MLGVTEQKQGASYSRQGFDKGCVQNQEDERLGQAGAAPSVRSDCSKHDSCHAHPRARCYLVAFTDSAASLPPPSLQTQKLFFSATRLPAREGNSPDGWDGSSFLASLGLTLRGTTQQNAPKRTHAQFERSVEKRVRPPPKSTTTAEGQEDKERRRGTNLHIV